MSGSDSKNRTDTFAAELVKQLSDQPFFKSAFFADDYYTISSGNSIRMYSYPPNEEADKKQKGVGQSSWLRSGRPYNPPEHSAIREPVLTFSEDTRAISSSSGEMSATETFHVVDVPANRFTLTASSNPEVDGLPVYTTVSTIKRSYHPRPGVFALEPVRGSLGKMGAGPVPYDGMTEDETIIESCVGFVFTELIRIPDAIRNTPARLRVQRWGASTDRSQIFETVGRERVDMPSGRRVDCYSVPKSVVDTGMLKQIIALAEAKATEGGSSFSLSIRFNQPQRPSIAVNRLLNHRISGATMTNVGIIGRTYSDHLVDDEQLHVMPSSSQ